MIIKSGFKDYYDFVANMYGGGDPKCIYLRTKLKSSDVKPHEFQLGHFKVPYDSNYGIPSVPQDLTTPDKSFMYKFKRLVVAGKSYLCYVKLNNNSPFGFQSDYNLQYKVLHGKELERYLEIKSRGYFYKETQPHDTKVSPGLVELSRIIKAPVFVYTGTSSKSVSIEVNCPILQNYEFPSIMSPQEIYQEVSYFIMNTMNVSPDMMPPSPMTDEMKIHSHGFDVKSSFRPKYKGKK